MQLFGVVNDDVEEIDFTTDDVPESAEPIILLSDESVFVSGSYEMSLSESSDISAYKLKYILLSSLLFTIYFILPVLKTLCDHRHITYYEQSTVVTVDCWNVMSGQRADDIIKLLIINIIFIYEQIEWL